ncbi:MAG: D-alanyl-D-alanine dipeptidase [Ignavibacteriae bacterium HGW-Ignavibacteriae-3]|nr:MAG: D-alanyl-D-alanine dipeptidase [Ignavibacteriae bacterium HGW-Ignavibacteriae-3]
MRQIRISEKSFRNLVLTVILITVSTSGAQTFRITPLRPVNRLLAEALLKVPLVEKGSFRKTELTEITKLDTTIHLDIRYATENNFLSAPLYHQARAFLQRPAAEALIRVSRALRVIGYGLLIHDAYRPWYITKVFWDATPPDLKKFVADPSKGSMHNRGCAVDLTLYDLKTGKPVVMPSLYDEMSDRAYPDYKGGTENERKMRDLLRTEMEKQGFSVYEFEWWHFNYKDWKFYTIQNIRFEEIK